MKFPTVVTCLVFGKTCGSLRCDDPYPDETLYDRALFAGTHNTAINLGTGTLLRPADAQGGVIPSEAHHSYQCVACFVPAACGGALD
jgi:hypothetical protein